MNTNIPLLENIEPEMMERITSRRNSLATMGKFGMAVAAVSSIPVTFGALAQNAYANGGSGASPQAISDVLNYALTLELLEDAFYKQALSSGIIPGGDAAIFRQISKHETAHVTLLSGLGATALDLGGTITFTKVFADVFTNYETLKIVAQTLEDTGVRAYKGRAIELQNTDTLTVALQIHSVEARHAAMIRRLRGKKGWITQANPDDGAAEAYGGEDASNGVFSVGADASTQAFDEPLTAAQVIATVQKYFVV